MSLLDDVSIVVTPNGYKAGELYAVIPTPVYGTEELTDGNFPTPNTEWNSFGLATINENIVNFVDAGSNTYSGITQDINSFSAKQYKVEITVTNWISGDILAIFGSNTKSFNITGNGTYSVYLTPVSNGNDIGLVRNYSSGANFSYSITNVSVKEYTSADMDVTRSTAATRVDENGLVNYAEIVGGEEITNGDFATNLDSWSTSSWWVWNSLGAYHPSTSLHKPLYQQCCVIGKTYKITFDLNCVGLSLAKFSLGSSTGSTTQTIDSNLTTGSYSYFVTAAAEYIVFNRQNTAEYYVNNVSVKEVTRDNVPRIDYTRGGCPHILAEPQRTNLIPYSEDFTQWSPTGATISSNALISPSGSLNADKLVENTVLSQHRINFTTTSALGDNTFSVFAKKGEREFLWLRIGTSSGYFNLSNGLSQGSVDIIASSIDYGNGWYKCIINKTNSVANEICRINITKTFGGSDYLGDGTSGAYIWGASYEQGSYATSYIPTSGSTVTRNQDIFTRDGIGSLINSTEGTFFAEIAALSNDGTNRALSLSDGTSSNRILIYYGFSSNEIVALITYSGITQVVISNALSDSTQFIKCAIKFKENDCAFWVNGVKVGIDTSSTAFSANTLNALSFDSGSGGSDFYGKVKQLQVYDTSLSDTQLAALTT